MSGTAPSPTAAVPREELIHAALCALHACTEADKELDLANCVVAVVGAGEPFHLLEGDVLAPYLLAVKGLPKPAGGAGTGAASAAAAAAEEEAEGAPAGGPDVAMAEEPAPPAVMDVT